MKFFYRGFKPLFFYIKIFIFIFYFLIMKI
nr:MAG TPA: hypothetical protein [Caudoviricetes sp.]